MQLENTGLENQFSWTFRDFINMNNALPLLSDRMDNLASDKRIFKWKDPASSGFGIIPPLS